MTDTTSTQPHQLEGEHLDSLLGDVRDWQFQHGSLLKYPPSSGMVIARLIGATLFPSNFPRVCFEEARDIQCIYNRLYVAIAADEQWLLETMKSLIAADSMAKILWEIHCRVKQEGYIQDLSLGIFRSDYMLHEPNPSGDHQIKQVEFNTYSVAGGAHSNKISNMHKHLANSGAYGAAISIPDSSLPLNHTIESIAKALASAHSAYGPPKSGQTTKTGILFTVQPNNINICDERPIEYALWGRGIPAYRVVFGEETLARTSLSPTRELLYHPPSSSSSSTSAAASAPIEISVIYHRAGYDTEEYHFPAGLSARYQLEVSRAIKAPSVLCHMATLKLVQQRLTMPGELERFLPNAEDASRIRKTFAPMYPMDDVSEEGRRGRALALRRESAGDHILKPSLEGGGHNVHGGDIPEFLEEVEEREWRDYILMEKIRSPVVHTILATPHGVYSGPVISELGIFGTCLWREGGRVEEERRESGREGEGNGGESGRKEGEAVFEILSNDEAGFSFKTKKVGVDEMSVVKGFGCFDSPYLI